MKQKIKVTWFLLVVSLLLLACSDAGISATATSDVQTIFSISQNLKDDAPASFNKIDWSQTNRITISEFRLEKFPVFVGEIDTGEVFPFYMDGSVVLGSLPVISTDGNYLAFQSDRKIYIALLSNVASNHYIISQESVVTVFDAPNRCNLAWSSVASQLASVCLVQNGFKISLYNLSLDEAQEIFQYFEKDIDDIKGISWSSDSAALAFSLRYRYDEENSKTSQKDIFVFRFDTHTLIRVTNTPDRDEQNPDWYPKSNILAFTITPEQGGGLGEPDSLLILSTEDGKCMKQVPGIEGVWSPSWSPDGSQMAYISNWESIKVLETSEFLSPDFLSPEGLCNKDN